ncbi:restriction endonuclease subunit S [Enterococcus sp. PFB1-1]|uniref:restriction endonuclease subunit S n=1 Tax=Enterococcus sp. PFB1-1 TaxID=2940634 RepID=UPI00247574B4|nr:restriction endonuclease subunit S [Enterococcus sp. PFB1-1]MDH6364057.1 type I restriction enzyme S subunit [Enterococcus sp. PFB1-1]
MSENKKGIPKLRYPEFTDEWEQRKVKTYGNDYYGGGTPKTTEESYWDGTLPWIQSSDLSEHVLTVNTPKKSITEIGVANSAAKKIPANSISIVTRVGVGKLAFMPYEFATSQDFISISDLNVNSLFGIYSLYRLLQKQKNAVQGTSIKGITRDSLFSMSLSVPNFIDEQQKIGNFFKEFDKLITLHQRKLDHLKNEKNGLLQKMFPKNGESFPVLRFPEFTDAWEQRKFNDFVIRLSKTSNSNQLPKVEFEDIIAGEGRLNKDVQNKFDNRKGTLFYPENILYGKLRPYLKNWLFPDFEGIALGDFWVFESSEANPSFIYSLIQSDSYQKVANDTAGTKMPRSDWKKVSNTLFAIPKNIEEQQKIGNFFKELDNLITLHQRKLDNLKLQKKALLQQMFV